MFTYSTEKELHEFIVNNFNLYFDFTYNSSEYIVQGGRVDILGIDDNAVYVIEIKRDIVTQKTIEQLSAYLPQIKLQSNSREVYGIAAAPQIDSRLDIDLLPKNISIKVLDNVEFIRPESHITRQRVTFTFDEELINYLKEVSEKTMIPQSRLAEQAIKEYLDKIKATKN